MADRTFSGFVSLTEMESGEVLHAAVMVTMRDGKVAYTVQTIDRSNHRTITGPRHPQEMFDRMMDAVVQVAAPDSV